MSLPSGPENIKLLSCSTQLSMKFEMLISIRISWNLVFSGSDKPRMLFFLLINDKILAIVDISERKKVHAQLSWAWKKFYDLEASYLFSIMPYMEWAGIRSEICAIQKVKKRFLVPLFRACNPSWSNMECWLYKTGETIVLFSVYMYVV